MGVFGTVLIPGANPVVNGTDGKFLYNNNGILGETDAPGGSPGGADTSIQFNDAGAFGGFGSWDGQQLTIKTIGDGDTNPLSLRWLVHEGGANEAEVTISVDGNSGNNTPDVTFTFPQNAIFSLPSGAVETAVVFDIPVENDENLVVYQNSASGGISKFRILAGPDGDPSFHELTIRVDSLIQISSFTNASKPFYFLETLPVSIATLTDADTSSPTFNLGVHLLEGNAATFAVDLDGASGNNTPNTTFTFPGAALFTGASSYDFDNAVIPGSFAFASLPTAATGKIATVTDSNTATWGATIAGGGANNVLARYNGANWTVVGV